MWSRVRNSLIRWDDLLIGLAVTLAAFWLYAVTLLPGVGIGDTAELQRVVPLLKLAHPTGYPLYTLLGWLWVQLPLGGSPAWRLSLFSALAAALAIGVLYLVARALEQRRVIAVAVALALAASLTLWSQATIAEVYGLATLLQALLLLALLRWDAGRWPFWTVGLIFGLGLAHHRTILLMVPGALLGLALSRRRPRPLEAGMALLLALGCCLLYLYVPLHAPPWRNPWDVLWEYLSASSVSSAWLNLPRLREEGLARMLDLARHFVWPELLTITLPLALLGAIRLLRRSRVAAALLLAGYASVFLFCSAYYVPDIQVFFIPLHVIAALLIGEGAMLIALLLPPRVATAAALLLVALPALLIGRNLGTIRAANTSEPEIAARARMAEMPREPMLVVGNWLYVESMRYLEEVEGERPNIEFALVADRQYILDTLARGRSVYLMDPIANLGLTQRPVGTLWQVSAAPLRAEVAASPSLRWHDGIELAGYTLHRGPYRPGGPVPLTLDWLAQEPPRQHYMLFVHVVGADGTIWGQSDREPSVASTDRWRPGEHYVDIVDPMLNPAVPPGRYRVTMGWYAYPSLERLPLAEPDAVQGGVDYVTLGEIEVAAQR